MIKLKIPEVEYKVINLILVQENNDMPISDKKKQIIANFQTMKLLTPCKNLFLGFKCLKPFPKMQISMCKIRKVLNAFKQ